MTKAHRSMAIGVSLAAAVLVFVAPLYVPMRPVLAESASYRAGYNNAVAIYAAIGLSVLVFLLLRWRPAGAPPELRPQRPMRTKFVAAVLVASGLVYAVSGAVVVASHTRYLADAGYMVEQATVRQDTGRQLYSQLEFAYGPLLLLPEIGVARVFHLSMISGYFVTLVVESTLGLLMVAYLLNTLPIRTDLKRMGLVLLALGAVTPHLGLNYTFFRFATPFAVALFGFRQREPWLGAVSLAVGEALTLMISPELGLAVAVGAAVFGAMCAWQRRWAWAAAAASPLAVLAVFAATVGQPFFRMVRLFVGGALNLPVGPYPHILVILFALVWLVPYGLGRMYGVSTFAAGQIVALYVISLALMRAALGRSDPLHVFFDGFGIVLLSLVVVSRLGARMRTGWIAAVAVLVLWNQYVCQRQFLARTKYVLAQAAAPVLLKANEGGHLFPARVVSRLHTLVGLSENRYALQPETLSRLQGTCVATPVEVSPRVEEQLRRAKVYGPGSYAFGVDEISLAAEQRVIADANRCGWMVLPSVLRLDDTNTTATLAILQGMRLPYRERHAPVYHAGEAFRANLAARWRAVANDGPYTIYRQVPPSDPGEQSSGSGPDSAT